MKHSSNATSGKPMTRFKDILSIVQSIAAIIAFVAGSIWFYAQGPYSGNLKGTVTGSYAETDDGKYLSAAAEFQNVGRRPAKYKCWGIRVFDASKLSGNLATQEPVSLYDSTPVCAADAPVAPGSFVWFHWQFPLTHPGQNLLIKAWVGEKNRADWTAEQFFAVGSRSATGARQ